MIPPDESWKKLPNAEFIKEVLDSAESKRKEWAKAFHRIRSIIGNEKYDELFNEATNPPYFKQYYAWLLAKHALNVEGTSSELWAIWGY